MLLLVQMFVFTWGYSGADAISFIEIARFGAVTAPLLRHPEITAIERVRSRPQNPPNGWA
jgi:hypothetical protein